MPLGQRPSRDEIEARFETTGGFMIPLRPSRRSGLVWALLLALIAVLALVGGLPGGSSGVDLQGVLEPFPPSSATAGAAPATGLGVARDLQETWRALFRGAGTSFRPAKLVTPEGVKQTGCGVAVESAAGAFYCGADGSLAFSGDDPYLIAHAYAHHVQEQLGITEQVARAVEASPKQARGLWLAHEEQAACLAGVWARSAGVGAVTTIPTDPDHDADLRRWRPASRERHASWFRRGSERGRPRDCNAFTSGRS